MHVQGVGEATLDLREINLARGQIEGAAAAHGLRNKRFRAADIWEISNIGRECLSIHAATILSTCGSNRLPMTDRLGLVRGLDEEM